MESFRVTSSRMPGILKQPSSYSHALPVSSIFLALINAYFAYAIVLFVLIIHFTGIHHKQADAFVNLWRCQANALSAFHGFKHVGYKAI